MEIIRQDGILRDFKKLERFPSAVASLEAWERLLLLKGIRETPGIEQYPGFGERTIFKGRVVPLRENVGKSKGYRVIFELAGEKYIIILFYRHGIYKTEKEVTALIHERLSE
jgi:hypothetical protein